MSENLISLLGFFSFAGMAWLLSNNKKKVNGRVVLGGLGLQLVLALLVMGIPALGIAGPLRFLFDYANTAVLSVLKFTEEGSRFLFGDLVDSQKYGLIIAFQILPIIIFMSALMALLYHLGVMQKIVSFFAVIMHKFLNVSGAESLSASANIFFGQTEAPLVVRPFLARMTNSELFCVMLGGMATVAGSVLGAYTSLLKDKIPDIAGHLLTASVLSAPAALVIAKIMLPETEKPETLGAVPPEYKKEKIDSNMIEAVARGASEGLYLALNVAAMLIAFIAMIAFGDALLKWMGELIHIELSLSLILGWFFAPFAWLMGIPWSEVMSAGTLLGQKMALNEFVAYLNLAKNLESLSERTIVILSYALCGFANFSSIGIQIGGIGSLVPERRKDLARLGLKAMIGGTLAAFMTAAIAGMLL